MPADPSQPGSAIRPVAPLPAVTGTPWAPPRLWRFCQRLALSVVRTISRLRITGEVADLHRNGPLILAGNHISVVDPVFASAACGQRGVAPRIMATGGLFRAPVLGWFMRHWGHIPVNRGRDSVADAVPDAVSALRDGSVIFIYPEGRIGLDPASWPERAKTGLARLALATGVPVVPVAIWGTHEVTAYHGRGAMARTTLSALWRRPRVRVHFGTPVDLSGLRATTVGDAQRATIRIMSRLRDELARLRPDEPALPRYRDPTKPVSTARRFGPPNNGRQPAEPGLSADAGMERTTPPPNGGRQLS